MSRDSQQCPPTNISSVAIIGAGVMGRGIAAANLERGIAVKIADADATAAASSVDAILSDVARYSTGNQCCTTRLLASACDAKLADVDLVIESVSEKLSVKQRVLATLESLVADEVVLASNTSSISISKIATALNHPERFCGLHFCHPVRHRPIVEVIRGEQTNDGTAAAAIDYVRALGKLPIVVTDTPGFLVNRLLTPYLNEALELILEGAAIEMVETSARTFGMPLGPFQQFDEYGIDVAVRTGATLRAAYPDRTVASELAITLYQAGRLGRKTGAGFYNYRSVDSSNAVTQPGGTIDAEVRKIIEDQRREHRGFSPCEVTLRLFLPMLLEATRVLDEKVVAKAGDVDAGLRWGLGFESPQGGLLRWADALGPAKIVELLKPLAPLGKRYAPTPLLLQMAAKKAQFYNSSDSPIGIRAA